MQAFVKYEAAGNDFILLEDATNKLPNQAPELYKKLCNRHFGIGADGLILLRKAAGVHFEMRYYNADGHLGSFCGNGARAAVSFAHSLGWVKGQAQLLASDGVHAAHWLGNELAVQMLTTTAPIEKAGGWYLNTGSPHLVLWTQDALDAIDVVNNGKALRYSKEFAPGGVNVNFVRLLPEGLQLRTYERGVEDETLSCGTGVTAAALVFAHLHLNQPHFSVEVSTPGGLLRVESTTMGLYLIGPVARVFEGEVALPPMESTL